VQFLFTIVWLIPPLRAHPSARTEQKTLLLCCLRTAACDRRLLWLRILALGEYVTIYTFYFTLALLQNIIIILFFKCLFHKLNLCLSPAELLGMYVTIACATATSPEEPLSLLHTLSYPQILVYWIPIAQYVFMASFFHSLSVVKLKFSLKQRNSLFIVR
jgi:hypothetical protein